MNPIMIQPINYSNRSWNDIVTDSVAKLQILNPEWTNTAITDLGITLIELVAYIADINNFYIDKMVNESYVGTALQRRSLLRLAELVCWIPPNSEPSTTVITFRSSTPLAGSVAIPAGTDVSTQNQNTNLNFYTTDDVLLGPSGGSVSVPIIQGSRFMYRVTATGFREYPIPDVNVSSNIDNISVTVDDVEWTFVKSFNESTNTDLHYTVRVNEDYNVIIVFGDGYYGRKPIHSTILIYYNTNNGLSGNVSPNIINSVVFGLQDQFGNNVNLVAANQEAAVGGNDPLSVDALRYVIKTLYTMQDRAVYKEDIEGIMMSSGFVRQVRCYDVRDDRTIGYYMVEVYVLVDGGLNASLYNSLAALIEKYKYMTLWYKIYDVTAVLIQIDCAVKVLPNFSFSSVNSGIVGTMSKYFSPESFKSGEGLLINQDINYSEIVGLINQVLGVDYINVKLNSDIQNVTIGTGQIAILNVLNITQL